MKLNKKVLKTICKEKIHVTKFLNLSGLELVTLKRVNECGSLHWLIARDNKLQSDEGLEDLKHLWYLDLSNNQMTLLGALSRYLALGTLILSNNNLKWVDLEKIRHAHILSISLHGNPCLDSDPYYRIHVIDCLPLIWELDGRLVTVTERLHVKQFFIDTELSQHPVRHKMGKTFRTSAIKNIGTEGIVSKQCKYIYSKFPMSETHTKHTDERRLAYLSHMVQEDIIRRSEEIPSENLRKLHVSDTFLDLLLEQRRKNPERCNMVMLLLVISLEFQLPTALMRSVLISSNLDLIGSVQTMPFFLLSEEQRTRVICVMLNAAKIQRDNKDQSGGLYPQLFMCLYYTVAQLTKISQTSEANRHKIQPIPLHADYRALMSGETVSLMLNVSKFFSYLLSDAAVFRLAVCATGDPDVVRTFQDVLYEGEDIFSVMTVGTAYKIVKNRMMKAIDERLNKINIKMLDIPIGDRYLSLSDSLPIKPLHSVIWATEFLTNGQCVPRLDPPILYPAREAAKPKAQQPKMGDKVLLGPQVVGEFTMILEGGIAMTKIDGVPLPNGGVEKKLKISDAHYTYVDLKSLCYARDIAMWRPIKTEGDKHTIHSTERSSLMVFTEKQPFRGTTEKNKPLKDSQSSNNTLMVYVPGGMKPYIRPNTSVGTVKKTQTSDTRSLSAGVCNTNTNYAIEYHDLDVDFNEDDDNHQNTHIKDVTIFKKDGNSNPNNLQYIARFSASDILLTDEPLSIMMANATLDVKYTSDMISRPCSPVQDASDVAEEIYNNNVPCDSESTQEHTDRDKETDGYVQQTEVATSPPLPQAMRDKDNDPTSHIKWSDQGQDADAIDDPIAEVTHPDLCKDENDSLVTQNSPPASVVDVENTFLTTVSKQAEGLDTAVHTFKSRSEIRGHSSTETDPNKSASVKDIDPTFLKTTEMIKRPKTSHPSGTSSRKLGNNKMPPKRPQSAADISYYTVNKNPVFLKISTAFDKSGILMPDLQHLGKDAWKSSVRQGRSRPVTATIKQFSTGSIFPPPQRPTSPISNALSKKKGLKVTRTDTWLGGGRDLYWEDVKERPKSGHTPGWKEGLPEDMKKQRSKSAYVTSTRPHLLDTLCVSSCNNCKALEVFPSDFDEKIYLMPHTRPLLQHLPPPASSPSSEDGHGVFLTFEPNANSRSSLNVQALAMSRQLVKVPNEDDLFFRSSHSAGYHNRAYSEDQHMLTYLDDQDRLSIHMLDSYPITLRERNYEKPILRKTEDGDFAGLITSNRAAFSRIHPTSASLGDLKPTVQVKSFNESSSGQSGTDIFVSGVHGKSIMPQVKPETAVRKSSANRDLSTDLSLGYGNRYDALGLNQKYEDEGISKDVVSGATDDQLGKVYVKVGEEDKVPDMSEGERLVLHVNLRMDLEEDELV